VSGDDIPEFEIGDLSFAVKPNGIAPLKASKKQLADNRAKRKQ